ncbi:MAG TPA: HipA family kinase [Polyangiaceae bacterium]
MALARLRAQRILAGIRRGSSYPVVVDTASGSFLMKLRGAAQGVPPLIAELIAAELATLLGLPVPERALITLDEDVPSLDRNDELQDVLGKSHGLNLGFRFLAGARDLATRDLPGLDPDWAARVLWLDGLLMNPDRTARNPNILIWQHRPWLVDHGASLSFHYDWPSLTEQTPREIGFDVSAHLLYASAARMQQLDAELSAAFTREVLSSAVATVPADFIEAAFPAADAARLRATYAAFLWKRLKAPRPFIAG